MKTNRLQHWFLLFWQINRKILIQFCLLTTILLSLFFLWLLVVPQGTIPKIRLQQQQSIYLVSLIICGVLVSYQLTKNWIKSEEGIYKNMLPFSVKDHIFGMTIAIGFITPIFFTFIYYLIDVPALWISNHLIDYGKFIHAYGADFEQAPLLNVVAKNKFTLLALFSYQLITSLFIFGMLSFRKAPFLSSALFTLITIGSVSLVAGWVDKFMLPTNWATQLHGWSLFEQGREMARIDIGIDPQMAIIMLIPIIVIGIYVANYYCLKEGETH